MRSAPVADGEPAVERAVGPAEQQVGGSRTDLAALAVEDATTERLDRAHRVGQRLGRDVCRPATDLGVALGLEPVASVAASAGARIPKSPAIPSIASVRRLDRCMESPFGPWWDVAVLSPARRFNGTERCSIPTNGECRQRPTRASESTEFSGDTRRLPSRRRRANALFASQYCPDEGIRTARAHRRGGNAMTLRLLRPTAFLLAALLATARAQTVTPPSITIPPASPVCARGSETDPACITLPPGSVATQVDVFFLFDDTGSFSGFVPTV